MEFRSRTQGTGQSPKPGIDSSSLGRSWSTNASHQLDKIDAIPSRTSMNEPKDNILIEGLCLEDQIYLKSLVEASDSSEGEEEGESSGQAKNASWSSPMIQNPVMMNKRIKMLKSHYAITLSLEDISYIRPSWGLSKGIKRIEINKKKQHKRKLSTQSSSSNPDSKPVHDSQADLSRGQKLISWLLRKRRPLTDNQRLTCYLILLTLVVLILMFPPILIERHRLQLKLQTNRLKLNPNSRIVEFYKPGDSSSGSSSSGSSSDLLQEPVFKLQFGTNIPLNLRPEKCDCGLFKKETNTQLECIACLDWAYRANLRVFIEQINSNHYQSRAKYSNQTTYSPAWEPEREFCYHFKWQNYNTLMPPLVDCLMVGDEFWFGLGDLLEHSTNSHAADSSDSLTKLDFEWRPLKVNLISDLTGQWNEATRSGDSPFEDRALAFGSYVNLTLISSSRIFVGNLRSDFEILMRLQRNPLDGSKLVCLAAACTDQCTETWQRDDHLEKLKLENNIFEYSICSSSSLKRAISRQLNEASHRLRRESQVWLGPRSPAIRDQSKSGPIGSPRSTGSTVNNKITANQITTTINHTTNTQSNLWQTDPSNTLPITNSTSRLYPEEIGLIERILFATSPEFLPNLDGSSIREYVDSIVNLDLKSSLILSIDTRWQTYEGSFKLNNGLFPKAKLLLEILHNKGFKIMFCIQPYLDGKIGLRVLNELFDSDRLYPVNFVDHKLLRKSDPRRSEEMAANGPHDRELILRRDSFFGFRDQSVQIRSKHSEKFPHLFNCKESLLGSCALFDLTKQINRDLIIASIKRIELLGFGADAIRIGGVHSNFYAWQDHYRQAVSELTKELFYREKLFTISRYSGDLGYIELAPRAFTWAALKSTFSSVLNLSLMGFSLIHPGSVWGDSRLLSISGAYSNETAMQLDPNARVPPSLQQGASSTSSYLEDVELAKDKSEEELATRWLQLFTFMPILQFNNLAPIERFQLHDHLRSLVRIRKTFLVQEMKRHLPFTPLIGSARLPIASSISVTNAQSNGTSHQNSLIMPLIRPIWMSMASDSTAKDLVIPEQFMIGPNVLVAPILTEGQRQRDIYLPYGLWRDELHKVSLRGGKWLRNYPIELKEIAWFTLDSRS